MLAACGSVLKYWLAQGHLCISLDQGLQTFLSEGYLSYDTTRRGPDVLRNVIVSGDVTFYQIKKFLVYTLFFYHWQNGFEGRIWPAGRSMETPPIDDAVVWNELPTVSILKKYKGLSSTVH